jgi:hypothetical protein
MKFVEVPLDHPFRPAVSRFIRATCLLNYDARVKHLPKTLLALVDKRNKAHAAGLRDFPEPFFSEHCLDLTIDTLLSEVSRLRVARSSIVEVPALASRTPSVLADADRVSSPEIWGPYHETGPSVLAFGRRHLRPFLVRWLEPAQGREVHAHA